MAIRYSITGDLRFISHHDTLRLFERALARAAIPVRFSEGFNPRPRMSLTLPRSVGISSSDETLLVELSESISDDALASQLGPQMPPGMAIAAVEPVADEDRHLPCEAEYELPIEADSEEGLREAAAALLSKTDVVIERTTPGEKGRRSLDVRPYITAIDVGPTRLAWSQAITPTGTIRPAEMLELLGLSPRDCLHRLHRRAVRHAP